MTQTAREIVGPAPAARKMSWAEWSRDRDARMEERRRMAGARRQATEEREAARLARKAARDAIPAKGTHDYYVWLLNKYAAENGEGIVRKIKPPQLCSLQLFDPFCHHPDYYIVGIMAGFLDLEFVAQWSAPIRTDEARVPFAKGVADVKSGAARLCDFAADLAKVRATAPRIFDAAVIRAHGRHKASTIIAQVVAAGCGKKLDGQFSKERLHKVYAQLRRMFA